jgi:Cu+-exporting ATPase
MRLILNISNLGNNGDCKSITDLFDFEPMIVARCNLIKRQVTFIYSKKIWNKEKITNYVTSLGFKINDNKAKSRKPKIELHSFLLLFSIIVSLPIFYNMLTYLPDSVEIKSQLLISPFSDASVQLIWASLLQVGVLAYLYLRLVNGYKEKFLTTSLLLVLATSGLFILSIVNIVSQDIDISNYNQYIYFDFCSLVIIIYLISKTLQHKIESYRINIQEATKPFIIDNVITISDNQETTKALKDVQVGDIIKVKNQSFVPLDGIVVSPNAYFNQAIVTNNYRPLHVKQGDNVSSGSINIGQDVILEVTQSNTSSILEKMVKHIDIVNVKSNVVDERLNRITNLLSLSVVGVAILSVILSISVFNIDVITALKTSLCLIIIFSPCSLILATPLPLLIGLSKLENAGITCHNQEALLIANECNNVVFIHSGILTQGTPSVEHFETTHKKFVHLLYTLEKHSMYPLAQTICQYLESLGAKLINEVKIEISPLGFVKGTLLREIYYFGTLPMLASLNLVNEEVTTYYDEQSKHGRTCLFFVYNSQIVAKLSLEDKLRNTASAACKLLKNDHTLYIFSPANKQVVLEHTKKLNILDDNIYAQLSPTTKLQTLENIQKKGKVLFIGDSVNDAPANIRSDLSLSFKIPGRLSAPTTDITIYNQDLTLVPRFLKFCGLIKSCIYQNMYISILIPLLFIPLIYLDYITLLGAVAVMLAESFGVAFNAFRIRFKKI